MQNNEGGVTESENWFEDELGEADDFPIREYDITASPVQIG